jgi:hypothetical protein
VPIEKLKDRQLFEHVENKSGKIGFSSSFLMAFFWSSFSIPSPLPSFGPSESGSETQVRGMWCMFYILSHGFLLAINLHIFNFLSVTDIAKLQPECQFFVPMGKF